MTRRRLLFGLSILTFLVTLSFAQNYHDFQNMLPEKFDKANIIEEEKVWTGHIGN